MDRPTCKLCFRRFPNGRALGGHMRSHVASAAPTKHQQQAAGGHGGFGGFATSPTSSSSSGPHQPWATAAAATKIHTPASYGLRENPRKSAKLADPEFSNPDVVYDDADYGDDGLPVCYYGSSYYYHHHNQHHQYASSAVVQDGESETESSMAAAAGIGTAAAPASQATTSSLRRRSKRRRRGDSIRALFPAGADAAPNNKKQPQDEEQAPVSSVSDATPDEDVALCLVMLSRDAWSVKEEEQQHRAAGGVQGEEEALYDEDLFDAEEDDDDDDDDGRIAAAGSRRRGGGGVAAAGGRGRFRCGTCKKTFRSYQALGGHRASHKKAKPWNAQHAEDDDDGDRYHFHNKQQPPRVDRIRHEQEEAAAAAADDYSEATGSASAAAAPVGGAGDPKIHRCPFCPRVFASGQALGGHKRSHFIYSASHHHYSYPPPPPPPKNEAGEPNGSSPATRSNTNNSSRKGGSFSEQLGESFLDLNLPAPVDELDAEVSAVSIAN